MEEKRTTVEDPKEKRVDFSSALRMPERFTALNKLILRDLNRRDGQTPQFRRYTREQIQQYIGNPYVYEQQLRDAVVYIYGASSHFRRLIEYFTALSDLSYVITPFRLDTSKSNEQKILKQYKRVTNVMEKFDVRHQFRKILRICLREDVFYGTIWETNDNITIQRLPSKYCAISAIEGNVLNVTFDFTYFNTYPQNLVFYPPEFETRYNDYKNGGKRYQDLDSPTSFCIKCNDDVLDYAEPPFAGILREIYDIEDYKALKMTQTEIENYALLVMGLGMNDDGEWKMDYDKAKEFWKNLDGVLPDEIGSVLSPMPIEKISFERSNSDDSDYIADAENRLFTAAGVSSLLFNNEKASSNALLLSIKGDQAITYGIVKNVEAAINRYIQSFSWGKNFRTEFLDCSPWNRKELGDQYIKACQYGFPMISYYCASQGLPQESIESMNYLEDSILGIKEKFTPLRSSATMSASEGPGRPESDPEDLSDGGEIAKEGPGDE